MGRTWWPVAWGSRALVLRGWKNPGKGNTVPVTGPGTERRGRKPFLRCKGMLQGLVDTADSMMGRKPTGKVRMKMHLGGSILVDCCGKVW